jgi:hypothetical protein
MILRAAVVAVLAGGGWAFGRAQTTQPDFELIVNAPAGDVQVMCVRGCALAWVERGVNPRATPQPTFSFSCSGTGRCSSGLIGGWSR